ncbi:MAG: DASS family sodium-coupled anion symporter [Gemmatimonadaceae bacterium]
MTLPIDAATPARALVRWAIVIAAGAAIALAPAPSGVTPQAWHLLAIFVATIVGSIVRPLPAGAIVLLGVGAIALTRTLPIDRALAGYGEPIVWLVLAAFFLSRGMTKTGLGRRMALLFIRAIGGRSLGLGYALVATDFVLASVIPSNSARAGGIIFPIARNICTAYESEPGPTARRLGTFLMLFLYQSDVILCAMFLTGQASNVLIAKFAKQVAGVDVGYGTWLAGAIVPGLVALALVPPIIYVLAPPELKRTPAAPEYAAAELRALGALGRDEWAMLAVFAMVAVLWMTTALHGINYTAVALLGIGTLLVLGVLDWSDILAERGAWDVFIWYGGLVQMAQALGETGLTKRFAEAAASMTSAWPWTAALVVLLLIYFYAHYGFASITAHATAMFIPFLVVILAAGAPAWIAVLLLAYYSNLSASLTHYGTTHAPIYFGAGYVTQRQWWSIGLVVSIANVVVWGVVGPLWWKLLGWW